jgi:hypothetical protein
MATSSGVSPITVSSVVAAARAVGLDAGAVEKRTDAERFHLQTKPSA